jgi:predicted DNA-binding transcriptional regulator AlpA
MSKSIEQSPDGAVVRPGTRLLSRAEVIDKVGICYPGIWRLMREGAFPRSVCVGERVFWIESEVDVWIAALPRRQLKGDTDGVPFRSSAKRKAAGAAT